jgi:hypothetical protein
VAVHLLRKQVCAGSSPQSPKFHGPVTHLVECLFCTQEAGGSNPLRSTIYGTVVRQHHREGRLAPEVGSTPIRSTIYDQKLNRMSACLRSTRLRVRFSPGRPSFSMVVVWPWPRGLGTRLWPLVHGFESRRSPHNHRLTFSDDGNRMRKDAARGGPTARRTPLKSSV